MPLVAGPGQPSADDVGELLAELERPLADRLVADLNAAEREHLLHHPKAQGKAKVQPHRVADPLRREAVAGVEGLGRARHARLIADPRPSGNPTRRQLDGAMPAIHSSLVPSSFSSSAMYSRTKAFMSSRCPSLGASRMRKW